MMSDNDNASEDLSAVSDDKPLSIAEEIASEVDNDDLEVRERYDLLKQTDTKIAELQKLSMSELIELARSEKITENKKLKVSFIQQVDQIKKANQHQASTDPENKILAEAGIKLSESLALLEKDLQTADSQLKAKQQELIVAQTAVTSAEAELASIMKMRESAPKVLQEKESSLKDAQNQLDIKQRDYTNFKVNVDQQKAKTDKLFQQYLNSLPK